MTILPTHCQASNNTETGICLRKKGHRGEHRFVDSTGMRIVLPDGFAVKFMGFTGN